MIAQCNLSQTTIVQVQPKESSNRRLGCASIVALSVDTAVYMRYNRVERTTKQHIPLSIGVKMSARLIRRAGQIQMGRYQWCPGKDNGSRYDLLFGMVQPGVYGGQMGLTESDEDESLYCLTWLERGGSGGGTIVFSNPPDVTYLMEKMDIRLRGDATALLDFLEMMQVDVIR